MEADPLAFEHRIEPIVLVLVYDDDADVSIRLARDGLEEPLEFESPAHCRDDEVDVPAVSRSIAIVALAVAGSR